MLRERSGWKAALLTVGLSACGISSFAFGQSSPSDDPAIDDSAGDDSETTSPVRVSAPVPVAERDPTAAVSVVKARPDHGLQSAGDLLRALPGVQLRSQGGFGQALSLSVRGTDHQQLLVILDDVPLNSSVGGGFDLSLLDVGGIDRLEVYRGGSPFFGSSALGGAVRLVPSAPAEHTTAYAGSTAGSFATWALRGGASVPFSGPNSGGGVQFDWNLRQSAGDFDFTDTNGQPRKRNNNNSFGLGLKGRATWQIAGATLASLSTTYHREKRGIAGVEQFPTPDARQNQRFWLTTLRFESPAGAPIDWSAQAWFREQGVDFANPTPPLPPPVDNRQTSRQMGAAGSAAWSPIPASWLSLRVETLHEWSAIDRTGAAQDPARSQFAVAAAWEQGVWDELFTVHPGVRVEGAEGVGWRALPKLGLALQLPAGVALRANAARTFRLPSFEELYFDSGAVRGNAELSPEEAWTFDFEIAWTWRWLRVQATGFWLELDNLILFVPKTAFLVEATNSGPAISRGVETEIRVSPWAWLSVAVGYTFTDARLKETGLRLPARAAHLYFARLMAELDQWASAYVELRGQGAFFLDRFEGLREEERLFVDFGLRARPLPWLSLGTTALNITNKRDAVDALQFPLPGRAFLFEVDVRW